MIEQKRIFAIGDVHGCALELERLLNKIELGANDRIIFLGDLINRGPDSRGVIDLVMGLPKAKFLMGNHEYKLLKRIKNQDFDKLKPADRETLSQLDARHWKFIKKFKTRVYKRNIDTLFVHGGIVPWLPWKKQGLDILMRIQVVDVTNWTYGKRKEVNNGVPWADRWHKKPFIVYGHTPNEHVYRKPYSIGIDTGCVFGGRLTAYEVFSQKIFQVKAKEVYVQPKAKGKKIAY